MSNMEDEAKAWRDRESATKFVENPGGDDRITVYMRDIDGTGKVEETYVLHRPSAGPEPIIHERRLRGSQRSNRFGPARTNRRCYVQEASPEKAKPSKPSCQTR